MSKRFYVEDEADEITVARLEEQVAWLIETGNEDVPDRIGPMFARYPAPT